MSDFQKAMEYQFGVYRTAVVKNLTTPNIFFDIFQKKYKDRLAAMTDDERVAHEVDKIIYEVHRILMQSIHDSLFGDGQFCDHDY